MHLKRQQFVEYTSLLSREGLEDDGAVPCSFMFAYFFFFFYLFSPPFQVRNKVKSESSTPFSFSSHPKIIVNMLILCNDARPVMWSDLCRQRWDFGSLCCCGMRLSIVCGVCSVSRKKNTTWILDILKIFSSMTSAHTLNSKY